MPFAQRSARVTLTDLISSAAAEDSSVRNTGGSTGSAAIVANVLVFMLNQFSCSESDENQLRPRLCYSRIELALEDGF